LKAVRYGCWPSPLDANSVATSYDEPIFPRATGHVLHWTEARAAEGGRQVIMRLLPGRQPENVLPAGFDARTRVHEYGGRAFHVVGDTVVFSNFIDQRLHVLTADGSARPLTNEPVVPAGQRFADFCTAPDGMHVICVRETHTTEGRVDNEIVAVALATGEQLVLVTGRDFVAAPRVSPDGKQLAWLSWDHPHMPWDAAELWVAQLTPDLTLGGTRHIAGGTGVSIVDPQWSPDGTLHFLSDVTGWYNLMRTPDGLHVDAVAPLEADFAEPAWFLGLSSYAFLPDGRIVCRWFHSGVQQLGVLDTRGLLVEVATPFTWFDDIVSWDGDVVAVAAGPRSRSALVRIDVDTADVPIGLGLDEHGSAELDPDLVSVAQPITFPTTDGDEAHALFYPPVNPSVGPPVGQRPPLIVRCHGGPTYASRPTFDLGIQFWTTRGFAVVDVNFRGSSGYGRAYRDKLLGNWGLTDVDDCVHAALHLAGAGLVDGARMVIRGGSGGGWATMLALARYDVFSGGCSLFGVVDAEQLAAETHKFESRYMDGLLGPLPEAADVYRDRSPLASADNITAPLLIVQGLDDKVVPPSQAELIVSALERRGVPHRYLAFEGEGHGFRKPEHVVQALEAEYAFYHSALGLDTT